MAAKRTAWHNNTNTKDKGLQLNDKTIWILYILVVLSVAGYIIYSNVLFGFIAFLLLLITIAAEVKVSLNEEGTKNTVYEVLVALVAIVMLFFILSIALGTSSPLDVIASCSMLPTMHRGDLVILHGISNMTAFLNSKHVPVVNVSNQAFGNMQSNMNTEFDAFYFYSTSDRSNIAAIAKNSSFPIRLYNTICVATTNPRSYYTCARTLSPSSELVFYDGSTSKISINGTTDYIASTSALVINNNTVTENYSNPIIVYKTTPNDTFAGDIIHRLYAAIKTNSSYYLLTKGDNNPGIDIEYGNYPINQKDVVGYVVADIPYLGYLKLILGGNLASPAGCNYTILR